jgi:hypothetical protein
VCHGPRDVDLGGVKHAAPIVTVVVVVVGIGSPRRPGTIRSRV